MMQQTRYSLNVCLVPEAGSTISRNWSKSGSHSFVEELNTDGFPKDEMQTDSG